MPARAVDWTKQGTSKQVFKTEVEVEYVHNLKELYKRIHIWLEEEGFTDFNGQQNFETLYWQTDQPNGLTFHHIWWRAFKNPGMDGAPQKYFTWLIKFNYQTVAVSKAEVMHKGKKWKMDQSNTILRYESHLIWNFERDFTESSFLKSMKNRWKSWIYKDRMKFFEDALLDKTMELHNAIKAYLDLRHNHEIPPSIHPPSALP